MALKVNVNDVFWRHVFHKRAYPRSAIRIVLLWVHLPNMCHEVRLTLQSHVNTVALTALSGAILSLFGRLSTALNQLRFPLAVVRPVPDRCRLALTRRALGLAAGLQGLLRRAVRPGALLHGYISSPLISGMAGQANWRPLKRIAASSFLVQSGKVGSNAWR